MTPTEESAARQYARGWGESGPQLDRLKWGALRAMTDEEGQRQSAAVLEMADLWLEQNPRVDRPSGLVEQQRWFARWWTSRK
jgi:hypothetical protein